MKPAIVPTGHFCWERCRSHFEPDGGLRDIYVLETNIEHWHLLYTALSATYVLAYSIDGNSHPVPLTVDEAFEARPSTGPLLNFDICGVDVACHFFTAEEIEFDIAPNQVTSEAVFSELLRFLQFVGDTVDRPVLMTYENYQMKPFIVYDPRNKKFEYPENNT